MPDFKKLEREFGELEDERDGWQMTATQAQENVEFYREVVRRIGDGFGEAAYTADDGTVSVHCLALKVPELVDGLRKECDWLKVENSGLEEALYEKRRHARPRKHIVRIRPNPRYSRRSRPSSSGAVAFLAGAAGVIAGLILGRDK